MATTDILTVQDIITDALRMAGVCPQDEIPDADTSENARRGLSKMVKAWQNRKFNLWLVASQSVTVTTVAAHTLDPVRPVQILSCRLKRGDIETPMWEMTRQEYDDLPLKTSTGLPTCFYYDKQREAARLYVWPLLTTAAGETLEITYEREMEDAELSDPADVPGEWWDAVTYSLADRMADLYGMPNEKLTSRAERELDLALSADREGSVSFCGDY